MNTRSLFIACLLTISAISAQAQWVQTNGPRNDILTYGGNVTSLATLGNDLFAGESGVVLSTDNGSTWVARNNGLNGMGVGQFIVSGDTIFTITIGGIFFSIDMGTNWIPLLSEVPSFFVNISAFAISNGNIIVGVRNDSTYLSSDNGNSWTALDTVFDVSCFAETDGNLYAGTSDGGLFATGVYVSTNNGVNWGLTDTGERSGKRFVYTLAANGGNLFESTLSGMFFSSDEGASWTAIESGLPDPSLYSSRIYALAINGQNIYAGTFGSGIFLSTNNGTSWSALPDIGLTTPYINTLLINNGNIYAGTEGGGVFLSTDNGTHWSVHNPLTLINSLINNLDTIGEKLFACTAVGLFSTTDSGANWTPDTTGMGAVSVNTIISNEGDLFAATSSNGMFRSTNNGINWSAADSGLTVINVTTLTQNNGILYAGSLGALYVSSNNGISWSNPAFGNQTVSSDAFAIMGKTFLAGGGGGVFYSPDSGKDWYEVQEVPSYTNINSFAVIGSSIYAGTSSEGIWLSNDSGTAWAQANDSGLTDTGVNILLANDGNLFCGTNSGRIFFSSDSAATWHPVDSGLEAGLQITSLAIKDSILYAGTRDSGIWRHSLLKKVSGPSGVSSSSLSEASLSIYPNPATNSIAIASSIGPFSIFDPLGRNYEVKRMNNALDVSSLPPGVYFVSDGHSQVKFVKE